MWVMMVVMMVDVCVFSFDCAGVLQIVPLVWSELAYINNATILSTLVHVNICYIL